MKCIHCGFDIPESVDFESAGGGDGLRSLFHCPECDASHIRQLVDHRPDGSPVYHVRLWGHPATTRRRKLPFPGSSAKNEASQPAV